MNRVVSFVAELEPAVLVQPALGTLHDPTVLSKPAAVCGPAAGQPRSGTPAAQRPPVRLGVVSAVAQQFVEPPPRPAAPAADGADRVDQRQQLRHVVTVGAGKGERHRRAAGVGEQVVFGAVFPAVHGALSRFFPPCMARTEVESTTPRDQSILSAPFNSHSAFRRSRSHTPARCQSRSRRQQVMPDPQPISLGRYSHGTPLLSTNRIPVNAWRWDSGLRPGWRRRRRVGLGSSGSIQRHSCSSSSGLATVRPPCLSAVIVRSKISFC